MKNSLYLIICALILLSLYFSFFIEINNEKIFKLKVVLDIDPDNYEINRKYFILVEDNFNVNKIDTFDLYLKNELTINLLNKNLVLENGMLKIKTDKNILESIDSSKLYINAHVGNHKIFTYIIKAIFNWYN